MNLQAPLAAAASRRFSVHKLAMAVALASAVAQPLAMAESGDTVYEEIIVTGQKIARSLQDTPSSVAVATELLIEQNNIESFSDFLIETANTHSDASGGFSIRGIDGFNVSGGGNSYLASVYVDGASLPQRMVYSGFSSWDVSQIEILRGPQSTLQGRNSLAGSVIMTTQAPSQEWEGKFRLLGGENGQREIAVAVGGGLVEDQLSFRFSGEKTETDGFITNITRNEASDRRENELYRLKFLLEPNALPEFSAQLSLTHSEVERGVISSDVPGAINGFRKRVTTNNDPQLIEDEIDLFNLEMKFELNENWDLTTVSSYSKVNSGWENYDNDNGPDDDGTRGFNVNVDSFSQELRFVFDYDKINGVIGAYYFDQKYDDKITGQTSISLASAGLTASFLQAAYNLDAGTAAFAVAQYAALDPAALDQLATADLGVESYALFADATYIINDSWEIFAGVRWDHESQENSGEAVRSIANSEDIPDPANYAGTPLLPLITGINAFLQGQVDQSNAVAPVVDVSYTTVLPKVGVTYHWNDDISTSFTVQQGYRSGGVGTNTARGTTFQYDPEYTANYELSWRSLWLDGALTANANIFYIDWTDQQVTVQLGTNSFDTETRNAGKSIVQGFELDFNYQVNNEVKIYGSVGQSITEFKDFTVKIPILNVQTNEIIYTENDLAGRPFADSPEWTSNLGVTYTADNGIFANFSVNYADGAKADVNPKARGLAEAHPNYDLSSEHRTLVNMKIGYEWESVGVYLTGKNILDEEYITSPEFLNKRTSRYTLGEARQLSLSIRGTF